VVFLFQPGAQAAIMNLCLPIPEVGAEAAGDRQVVELQLDGGGVLGNVATRVHRAYFEADDFASFVLGFHNHAGLPIAAFLAVNAAAGPVDAYLPVKAGLTVNVRVPIDVSVAGGGGWIQCKKI
jgi:hypothetical protein